MIAESYQDSQERWAEEELPNEDAPNVIIFLLDDVGFAQVGTFGALIDTPTIDRLADNFNADLDRVLITVPDENTVPPRQLPATYY